MRVFLDANFLVAAGFNAEGDYHEVLNRSSDTFIVSEHILSEVARNLERLRCESAGFLSFVRTKVEVTDRFDLLPAGLPVDDSGDRQALAEAIGAGCDLFVTSDTDFAALFGQRVKGVLIMKSALYVRGVLAE